MKQLASLGIIATLLLAGAAAQSGSSADVQLKAAMHKELVDGDLNAAIEQYKKLLKRPGLSRADAAKVLLHLGECYEKLGDAEARKVYDRVLREYADQTASAAVARGKLDRLGYGMGSRSTGATARHIASADGLNSANVSPDGRFLSYFDEGIWLLDLVGGQKRRLTPATEQDFLDDTVFSPDSKQLAYDWNKRGRAEIHAINLDGSGDRVIYAAQEYLGLWDWVVGKMLVSHGRPDLGMELLTISTNDGSAHKIKEFDRNLKRKTRSLMLSPDGRWIATGRTTDTGDPTNRGDQDILLISTADGVEAPLVPQAGDVRLAGWTPDGKGIVFASDMEGHGNSGVYSLRIENGKPVSAPVLIRHEIGNVAMVRSLGLTSQGSFHYVLMGGTFNVMTAELDAKSGKVAGQPVLATNSLLGTNDGSDWSTDGTKMVYRTRFAIQPGNMSGEGANLAILDTANGKVREITPRLETFTDPRWSPDAKTILLKGRSAGREGLFLCDSQNGETRTLAEGPLHDPLWTRDGKSVVYIRLDGKSFFGGAVVLHNLETGRTKELYRSAGLVSRTMALSPDGTHIAFVSNNTLMTAPIASGAPRTILQLAKPETFEYYGGLAWMSDGRHLAFIKRPTGTTGRGVPSTLWQVPADGGPAEEMGLSMRQMHYLSVHPDGQRIAFSIGFPSRPEVWAVEGFSGFKR